VRSEATWNPDSCAFGAQGELVTAHQIVWAEQEASLLLTRFDGASAVTWQRVWNRRGGWPTHTLEALGLGVHEDGRISWAGRDCLQSAAAPAAANPGYYAGSCINAHVATLSEQGVLLWELPFGTRDGADQITDLALAPDGGLYVGGMFQPPLLLPGLEPPETYGGSDFFVLALDRTGRPRWVRTFGSPEHEGDGVRLASGASGELGVHGNFTQSPGGGFAALIDQAGSTRWQAAVSEHTVGHALMDGETLLVAASDALLAFDGQGSLQRRPLLGASRGAHLARNADNSLILYTPGAGLIEAAASGQLRRRLDLHDWREPWYYGSMCTGPGGVIGVVGTVRDPTDFGFLNAPLRDAAGASFVLHLVQWEAGR
jgi:outer membrane protein assembly factor BamB